MKKQRTQVIALVALIVVWALLWHLDVRTPPPVVNTAPAKVTQAESPLKARFRHVRYEMDSLYHYRIKPTPFDGHWNPFRIPGVEDGAPAIVPVAKPSAMDASQLGIRPPDFAETLLKSAIDSVRIGGVVTMKGTIQLTVDAQLHKQGDVFTARVPTSSTESKPIRIRIRQLSEAAVTFALDDPDAGNAELKVRLK